MNPNVRKLWLFLFWVAITLLVLYDRRFLVEKIGLGHFLECTVVRVVTLMTLAYVNVKWLVPRFLESGRWLTYFLLLVFNVAIYIFLQQAYDVYLYGFVIGDEAEREWRVASLNLILTSLWYVLLTVAFYKTVDWYDQQERVSKLEDEIAQLKDREASLAREEGSTEIFVKSGLERVRIDRNEVLYVQGLKDYAIIFTTMGKVIVKGTLKNVEELFAEGELVRIHKSYLVAKRKVTAVTASKVKVGENEIPVGRVYRGNLEVVTASDKGQFEGNKPSASILDK